MKKLYIWYNKNAMISSGLHFIALLDRNKWKTIIKTYRYNSNLPLSVVHEFRIVYKLVEVTHIEAIPSLFDQNWMT